MSGAAGKNVAVQLLPLMNHTLLELRRYTTDMLVLSTFLLSCFTVLRWYGAAGKNTAVQLFIFIGWSGMIFDLRVRRFCEMGWYRMILGCTSYLRKCFMSKQRDRDSNVDPTHLEL